MEKPFFLSNKGVRLYAVAHIPDHDPRLSCLRAGVVYCHPFLYEHYHSYPLGVALARALCRAGIVTLRLDLRGYGNSDGEFQESKVSDWISDIHAAVEFLRTALPLSNIGLIGLRLGANLAAWSASENSRIDWLVLGEPILEIQRYFRELLRRQFVVHAFQQGGSEESVKCLFNRLDHEGMLDIMGYQVTKSLYEELKAPCAQRTPVISRTLILYREDDGSSEGISTVRERLGLDGIICDVRSVHYRVPWQRLERMANLEASGLIRPIVEWITNSSSADRHVREKAEFPSSTSDCFLRSNLVECEQNTSRQEIPVSFTSQGARLLGILRLPDLQLHSDDIGMIILPGEPDTVSGPHQLYTKAARRLSDAGFPCLRFDYRGTGDSEDDTTLLDRRSMLEDLSCALAFFRETTGIQSIVLVGLCAGATLALITTLNDHAIAGSVLWSPEPFQIPSEILMEGKNLGLPSSVLLIYGMGDPNMNVSSRYYTAFLKNCGIPYKEIYIEHADHTFRSTVSENAVIDITVKWMISLRYTNAHGEVYVCNSDG